MWVDLDVATVGVLCVHRESYLCSVRELVMCSFISNVDHNNTATLYQSEMAD